MKKSVILSVILFLALISMLVHADYVTEGARYGLLLWYHSVVPALFPFMVLSGLIVALGEIHILMEPFYRVLHLFFPISKDGCYVLTAGLLCGYPMGAKTCADFVREGRISLSEGKFLMSICNHPSPMFLLGFVYPFFQETFTAPELLICIYGPLLVLSAVSCRIYLRKGNENSGYQRQTIFAPNLNFDETILSSVTILCKIGGYLVIFSIIIVFLRHADRIPNSIRLAMIGALEMTTGVRELAASLRPSQAFICSVAALTFGGCSGIFQTKSVLSLNRDSENNDILKEIKNKKDNEKKAGLSIRPYIFWKLFHAALSAVTAWIVCRFATP